MKCNILYEDQDVLVIYKPAGLAVQTAKIGQADVVSELKNYLASPSPYLGIVHRLDQPVEGLLVFAKQKAAAASLSKQLVAEDSTLNKHYYAVVCGKPTAKAATLEDKLYKDASGVAKVGEGPQAKRAVLRYEMLEVSQLPADVVSRSAGSAPQQADACGDGECSLLDVEIETGRFHQIRAQLSHADMPILGDSKYANVASAQMSAKLGVRNVALCAYRLSFCHPRSGKRLSFSVLPQGTIFSRFALKK